MRDATNDREQGALLNRIQRRIDHLLLDYDALSKKRPEYIDDTVGIIRDELRQIGNWETFKIYRTKFWHGKLVKELEAKEYEFKRKSLWNFHYL